jgi:imidazoleglycerol-phosphate dehydratase
VSKDAPGVRYAEVEREIGSATIRVVVDLDGERQASVRTGIEYFDYLLSQLAFFGKLDLGVSIDGLYVDDFHTIETIGECFGEVIRMAMGEADGLDRYGAAHAPIDDALARAVIDISGRPHAEFDAGFSVERIGDMSSESVEAFFRSIANFAYITIHIHRVAGSNNHHICEAIFKAFGRALREAVHKADPKPKGAK